MNASAWPGHGSRARTFLGIRSFLPLRVLAGIAAAVCCLGQETARAEPRFDADVRVQMGFSGVLPPAGALCPVQIAVRNEVAHTNGVIELVQVDASNRHDVTRSLPFSLPCPSSKRFFFLFRREEERTVRIRLRFEDHFNSETLEIGEPPSELPLVLLVDCPPSFRGSRVAEKYRLVPISARLLPEDPLAWDAIHAAALSPSALSLLTPGQVLAVRSWLLTGGVLLLPSMDLDAQPSQRLDALTRPIEIRAGSCPLHFAGMGLVGIGDAPPGGALPFWDADPELRKALFPAMREEDESFASAYGSAGLLSGMWRPRRGLGARGFFWIAVILFLYVLAICPLDRWIARRLGRPHLTWITLVAAILVFSIAAHGYNRVVNLGVMSEVSVATRDLCPRGNVSRCQSSYFFYSVKNGQYLLAPNRKGVHLHCQEPDLSVGSSTAVTLLEDADLLALARVPVFSSKTFRSAWYEPFDFDVQWRWSKGGAVLSLYLPEDLQAYSVHLARKDGLARLKEAVEVEGQSVYWVNLELELEPWSNATSRIEQVLQKAFRYGGYGTEEETFPTMTSLEAYLLFASFREALEFGNEDAWIANQLSETEMRMDLSSVLDRGSVLLLAIQDEALSPVEIQGTSPKKLHVEGIRVFVPEEKP